ncbi:lysoplasmalogenase [Mesoflavibacter profundi]|uniref:lysoplasmalogenase n=1 Tax=Mesoflavibacter profundi TaxID=2708110 RepID=UPI00168B0B52|nr:lysoplasmalogenase [Mesoflavibacter profundi]
MKQNIFKNFKYFTLLYLFVLVIDTFVKNSDYKYSLRYITKPLLVVLLIVFFLINNKEKYKSGFCLVLGAYILFFLGDILLIGNDTKLKFAIGGTFFGIAKVLLSIRFTNTQDFEIKKLLPFLAFCFVYMSVIMLFIYNNLKFYFIPSLCYLLVVMMMGQFAYLRKKEVNNTSYYLVLFGVFFSMLSDGITFLKVFYDSKILYHTITIMSFYAISQFLIVVGIVKETSSLTKLKLQRVKSKTDK